MKMKEELSPETTADAKEASSPVETIVMCTDIDVGMKGGTWQPKFTIGNQTFWLSECENKESAEWMSDQLQKALKNLCKMQRKLCYQSVKDRVDYHAPQLAAELAIDPFEHSDT